MSEVHKLLNKTVVKVTKLNGNFFVSLELQNHNGAMLKNLAEFDDIQEAEYFAESLIHVFCKVGKVEYIVNGERKVV